MKAGDGYFVPVERTIPFNMFQVSLGLLAFFTEVCVSKILWRVVFAAFSDGANNDNHKRRKIGQHPKKILIDRDVQGLDSEPHNIQSAKE